MLALVVLVAGAAKWGTLSPSLSLFHIPLSSHYPHPLYPLDLPPLLPHPHPHLPPQSSIAPLLVTHRQSPSHSPPIHPPVCPERGGRGGGWGRWGRRRGKRMLGACLLCGSGVAAAALLCSHSLSSSTSLLSSLPSPPPTNSQAPPLSFTSAPSSCPPLECWAPASAALASGAAAWRCAGEIRRRLLLSACARGTQRRSQSSARA